MYYGGVSPSTIIGRCPGALSTTHKVPGHVAGLHPQNTQSLQKALYERNKTFLFIFNKRRVTQARRAGADEGGHTRPGDSHAPPKADDDIMS